MATGCVPVGLDNPCERNIVDHGRTGLVVGSPEDFAGAVRHLHDDRDFAQALSAAASDHVRTTFRIERTVSALDANYERVLARPPSRYEGRKAVGSVPFEWWQSGAGRFAGLASDAVTGLSPILFERSKGSPLHYNRLFPDDGELGRVVRRLQRIQSEG